MFYEMEKNFSIWYEMVFGHGTNAKFTVRNVNFRYEMAIVLNSFFIAGEHTLT